MKGEARNPKLDLRAWMSAPHAIAPDALVSEARLFMRSKHIRHLPVVREGELVGIVTDRDVRGSEAGEDDAYDGPALVHDIMSTILLTATPSDRTEYAARVMIDAAIGCLPILDEDRELVGIVTTTDLLRALMCAVGPEFARDDPNRRGVMTL
jgi:acetoin utilization protein AcuB